MIGAPAAVCFAAVCDTPRTPEWHKAITAAEVLEVDEAGRTSLVRASIDALVSQVDVELRLGYEEARSVSMRRESGDLHDLYARWTFEDLDGGRCHVTFETEFDPGRVLSMFARGPLYSKLEALLAKQPPIGLKCQLENTAR